MAASKQNTLAKARAKKLSEAVEILRTLGFAGRQRNEVAGYTLLALLDLEPTHSWNQAKSPLRGITPIIEFVGNAYGLRYAPNNLGLMAKIVKAAQWEPECLLNVAAVTL